MRKIEFFEKYGTMEGTHTEHRLKARMAGAPRTETTRRRCRN